MLQITEPWNKTKRHCMESHLQLFILPTLSILVWKMFGNKSFEGLHKSEPFEFWRKWRKKTTSKLFGTTGRRLVRSIAPIHWFFFVCVRWIFEIYVPSQSLTVCNWKVTFPIGKDRFPTIIFQGRYVKLQGCIFKKSEVKVHAGTDFDWVYRYTIAIIASIWTKIQWSYEVLVCPVGTISI